MLERDVWAAHMHVQFDLFSSLNVTRIGCIDRLKDLTKVGYVGPALPGVASLACVDKTFRCV